MGALDRFERLQVLLQSRYEPLRRLLVRNRSLGQTLRDQLHILVRRHAADVRIGHRGIVDRRREIFPRPVFRVVVEIDVLHDPVFHRIDGPEMIFEVRVFVEGFDQVVGVPDRVERLILAFWKHVLEYDFVLFRQIVKVLIRILVLYDIRVGDLSVEKVLVKVHGIILAERLRHLLFHFGIYVRDIVQPGHLLKLHALFNRPRREPLFGPLFVDGFAVFLQGRRGVLIAFVRAPYILVQRLVGSQDIFVGNLSVLQELRKVGSRKLLPRGAENLAVRGFGEFVHDLLSVFVDAPLVFGVEIGLHLRQQFRVVDGEVLLPVVERVVIRHGGDGPHVRQFVARQRPLQLVRLLLRLGLTLRQLVRLLQMIQLRLPPRVEAVGLLLHDRLAVFDLPLFEASFVVLVRQRSELHERFAQLRADILFRRQKLHPKRVAVVSVSHRAVPRSRFWLHSNASRCSERDGCASPLPLSNTVGDKIVLLFSNWTLKGFFDGRCSGLFFVRMDQMVKKHAL